MTDERGRVLRIAHHGVVDEWRDRERGLRAQGWDVHLVSARRWNEGGKDVTLATAEPWVTGARTWGTHPSVFAMAPRALWRELGRGPVLVDLHEEPNALIVAQVRWMMRWRGVRAPILLYSAQNITKTFPVPFRWWERRALARAAGAYVCNVEARDILRAKGLHGEVRYIPLGVDVDRGEPRPAQVRDPSRPVVGYVGRLDAHKGVDVLLRAAAARPSWRVHVTGDGPRREALMHLSHDLGIAARVTFLGHATGDDLERRYRELDVIAVPSLPTPTWREQFCRVAVEAMARGVPVVASDTGAIPDVVGTAGVLVDPGDAEALAAAVDATLDPEVWQRAHHDGLARAASFRWEEVCRQHSDLYASVLTEARRPVHVLSVAYGPPDDLGAAIAALREDYAVTVVDNSSRADTAELCETLGVTYIDAGSNRGFAGGVNLGAGAIARDARSRGEAMPHLLLLNPDARIAPAGVEAMVEHLDRRVAAVGATQFTPDGRPVRVWWPFPTPWGAWVEAMGGGALRRSRGFAIGSVLLLHGAAWERVGPLDERFFLYAEEVDWQRRARRAGWEIRVARAEAFHEGAGTGGDPVRRETHFYASAEHYIRKHYGAPGWAVYRAAIVVGAGVRGLVLHGDRGSEARRRRRLFVRGPARAEQAYR